MTDPRPSELAFEILDSDKVHVVQQVNQRSQRDLERTLAETSTMNAPPHRDQTRWLHSGYSISPRTVISNLLIVQELQPNERAGDRPPTELRKLCSLTSLHEIKWMRGLGPGLESPMPLHPVKQGGYYRTQLQIQR
ncbi:hypothetical protein PIIN_10899 [Serendipita indica DSM 11827]|uniref:Uncharacterized protein n=1 Tax=Serendipita indica (strain DSM 11827) TaxID=1109443 RepID=G4U023_SERID|nr:hypothetical protein PIIN_10899 [Serendipita indica DSM 11827]